MKIYTLRDITAEHHIHMHEPLAKHCMKCVCCVFYHFLHVTQAKAG